MDRRRRLNADKGEKLTMRARNLLALIAVAVPEAAIAADGILVPGVTTAADVRETRAIYLDVRPCVRGDDAGWPRRVSDAAAADAAAAVAAREAGVAVSEKEAGPLLAAGVGLLADFAVGFISDWLKRRQDALTGTFLATGAGLVQPVGAPPFRCLIIFRGVLDTGAAQDTSPGAVPDPIALRNRAALYIEAELSDASPAPRAAMRKAAAPEAAPRPALPERSRAGGPPQPLPPGVIDTASLPLAATRRREAAGADLPKWLLSVVDVHYGATSAGRPGSGWKNVTAAVAFSARAGNQSATALDDGATAVYRFDLGRLKIGRNYGPNLLVGARGVQAFDYGGALNVTALVTESEQAGPALVALATAFTDNKESISDALKKTLLGKDAEK
jgi:hypothetical protein